MSVKRQSSGALLAVLLLVSLQALADDPRALYRQHCAKCHADDGRGNTWRGWLFGAENLSERAWQDKRSDADILRALDEGPGAMPAYRDRLDQAERQAVLQAVRELAAQ